MSSSASKTAGRAGFYTTAASLAVLFLFPLAWSTYSSLRPGTGAGFGLGNYTKMASYGEGVATYFLNTAAVATMSVAGTLLVSSLGGYAFARFDFPGKNLLFVSALAILMVPYATILIPLYVLLAFIGLQNTLVGLSLVLIMFQLPFALFMMRNSFEAVPRELEEAALVDGCSSFTALVRILLHAVRPGLVTVGLFAFLASWNDFLAPLILIQDGSRFTLPVALFNMTQRTFGAIDYGALEAGVVVASLPCLILFLVLQRHYVRGFMSGAIRG